MVPLKSQKPDEAENRVREFKYDFTWPLCLCFLVKRLKWWMKAAFDVGWSTECTVLFFFFACLTVLDVTVCAEHMCLHCYASFVSWGTWTHRVIVKITKYVTKLQHNGSFVCFVQLCISGHGYWLVCPLIAFSWFYVFKRAIMQVATGICPYKI